MSETAAVASSVSDHAMTTRFPGHLYRKLRRVAFAKECSIADVLREAVEAIPDVQIEVRSK